jgi:hypothetical protein
VEDHKQADAARVSLALHHRAWDIMAILLPAAIFWLRGFAHLRQRHPHEDAFILFRYAEHLAAGHGIVFNAGGPQVEGATDFLFLVWLAGLVRIGFDVAVGALLLNTLASGAIGLVLARLHRRENDKAVAGLVGLLLASAVPFLAGAHASYDGFGTQAYCALAVCAYGALVQRSERALVWLTYLALALGLFRPDGVILGVGFYLTALFLATHQGYAVYAVHYNASYTHVFGIREGRASSAAIERALLESYRQPYLSYAAAKKFR